MDKQFKNVHSDVAEMPFGAIVRSPIMVDDSYAELGRTIGTPVPRIEV